MISTWICNTTTFQCVEVYCGAKYLTCCFSKVSCSDGCVHFRAILWVGWVRLTLHVDVKNPIQILANLSKNWKINMGNLTQNETTAITPQQHFESIRLDKIKKCLRKDGFLINIGRGWLLVFVIFNYIVLIFNSFPLQDSNISSFIDLNLNFDKKDLFILFLFIRYKNSIWLLASSSALLDIKFISWSVKKFFNFTTPSFLKFLSKSLIDVLS